ncbi:hypothetical protein D3C72_936720 [compost metagenome]
MQRRQGIAKAHTHPRRRRTGGAGGVANPAHGFAYGTETRTIAIRAGLAVSGNPHQRQVGVERVQHVPTEAEFFQGAGAQVLDQHIGAGRQLLDQFDAFGGFEVQCQGLLVARLQVPPQRGAFVQLAPFAQGIALAHGFDLDHLGAELGQHARGERRGDQRADLDHFDCTQGGSHRGVPLVLGI